MAKAPDGLRQDLAAAVALESTLFGYKKSLSAASEALRDDEHVLAATTARRKLGKAEDNGALVVTDQRLLFVHARAFAAATEEIPLTNISGLTDRKGLGFGHIVVTGAGGITPHFSQISKSRIAPVMDAIRGHLARPSAPEQQRSMSVADELRKLAELRDAGILTDNEFTAKKAQLLDL
jgi:hypothetical protein